MLSLLFPRQIDNEFRGRKPGLWLFALIVLVKGIIGLNSILNGHEVAQGADGIPLDSFPPAAAQQVVSLFGLLGLLHLMIALVCLLALVRYRAMIPLLYLVLLLERLGRQLVLTLLPGAPGLPQAPGSMISLALLAAMVAGLALSVWPRREISRP